MPYQHMAKNIVFIAIPEVGALGLPLFCIVSGFRAHRFPVLSKGATVSEGSEVYSQPSVQLPIEVQSSAEDKFIVTTGGETPLAPTEAASVPEGSNTSVTEPAPAAKTLAIETLKTFTEIAPREDPPQLFTKAEAVCVASEVPVDEGVHNIVDALLVTAFVKD
ncbi:uncharacterized protein [Euwallacea fornicatus]|uniref:uncharacterized protein n=1 Tax=Euwallacea fornicatus TaxID=995702 RepID=UPI00338E75DC